MKDGEGTVGIGDGAGQTPDGNGSGDPAAFGGWPALGTEHLPGQIAATLPTGPFRPYQEHLALVVDGQGRMFAAIGIPRRGFRLADDHLAGDNQAVIYLALSVPGSEQTTWPLG